MRDDSPTLNSSGKTTGQARAQSPQAVQAASSTYRAFLTIFACLAVDGTSFWITGEEARAHAHTVRAEVDAILVGTATVRTDDPELSARPAGVADPHQPLRAVMGVSDTPGARVWRDTHAVALRTHDPREALSQLEAREVRTVIVEGGGTVTTAFLRAGLVDEVHAYIAPALLGSGTHAVGDLGIGSMGGALRGQHVTVTALGVDTLVTAFFQRGPQ